MTTIRFSPFIGIKEKIQHGMKSRVWPAIRTGMILALIVGIAYLVGMKHRDGNSLVAKIGELEKEVAILKVSEVMSAESRAEALDITNIIVREAGGKIGVVAAAGVAAVIQKKCQLHPEVKITPGIILSTIEREANKWDPKSDSPTGAKGLMQVVGTTFRKHLRRRGIENVYSEEVAHDPVWNVDVGIEELIEQRFAFGEIEKDSWLLTLTAYRWGPEEVRKLLESRDGGRTQTLEYAIAVMRGKEKWDRELAGAREMRRIQASLKPGPGIL